MGAILDFQMANSTNLIRENWTCPESVMLVS